MVRPTYAHIDLDAIRANFLAVQSYVGGRLGGVEVIAVVKANGYGHGAVPVARALETAGATMLACADIEEGVELRRGGIRAPILVFGALSVSDLDGVFTHNFFPVRRPCAARRGIASGDAGALSLEDRHRHEPVGFPRRQPCGHDASGVGWRRTGHRRRVYPFCDGRGPGAPAV